MSTVELWWRWLRSCSGTRHEAVTTSAASQPAISSASSDPAPGPAAAPPTMVVARKDHRAADSTELTVAKSECLQLLVLDTSATVGREGGRWRLRNAVGREGFVPVACLDVVIGGRHRSRRRRLDRLAAGLQGRLLGHGRQGEPPIEGSAKQQQQPATEQSSDSTVINSETDPPVRHAAHIADATAATVQPTVVTALYAYAACQPDELTLAHGDRILVTERSPDGWWLGRHLGDNEAGGDELPLSSSHSIRSSGGWFPSNHVVPAETRGPLYRVRALYPFVATHSEELSFAQGEELIVLAEPPDDPDWLMAAAVSGVDRRGLVPRIYVAKLAYDDDSAIETAPTPVDAEGTAVLAEKESAAEATKPAEPAAEATKPAEPAAEATKPAEPASEATKSAEPSLSDLGFYWGQIGRAEADELLMRLARPGQFLVRAGESNPKDLTLTIRAQTKSRNFKIRRVPSSDDPAGAAPRYKIGQREFQNLLDLVRHYSEHPIYRSADEQCFLVTPFTVSKV